MTYRLTRRFVVVMLILSLALPALHPSRVAAADCSSVYAALPAWINDAIAQNIDDYKRVSSETGVPWEMLAGIHYRETNFSRSNPSNGYGIFQFTPPPKTYPPGPVSDSEFLTQLRYMANKVQSDYVFRSGKATRKLVKDEKNMALIKDTLFSYNGRAAVYANQASTYGFSSSATPYEGSPYVMNRFDCARASMGIITQDYGSIDGKDTRYGAFTMYARLKGDTFWKNLSVDKTARFRFERLYGVSPAVVPTSASASYANYTKTISVGESIYVFHYDASSKSLRYTLWDGVRWSNHVLDGAGASTVGAVSHDVGRGIDAAVYNGTIQVYYYDATDQSLRHAWKSETDNSSWRAETMDGTASSISATSDIDVGRYPRMLLRGSSIQLFYHNATDGSLRHAWWGDNGMWKFETLDGAAGSVSGATDKVGIRTDGMIMNDNGIQLFYHNATDGSLRHAWWGDNGMWKFETLDGAAGSILGRTSDIGSAVSVAMYNGRLQLFYYDRVNGELIHSWWSESKWKTEIFDGRQGNASIMGNSINAGQQIKTAVFNGSLYVYYYDNAQNFSGGRTSGWRLAYWYNRTWNGLMLDGGNNSLSGSSLKTGGDISIAVHDNRQNQVFYQDSTGGLRHAWFSK